MTEEEWIENRIRILIMKMIERSKDPEAKEIRWLLESSSINLMDIIKKRG